MIFAVNKERVNINLYYLAVPNHCRITNFYLLSMNVTKILTLLGLLWCCSLTAQSAWSDVANNNQRPSGERRIIPQQFRYVSFDLEQLNPILESAPERYTPEAAAEAQPILTLPMPDGTVGRFRITESPVMESELQTKYPEIRTYSGQGVDDPSARLKCDLTPWGFHAMVSSARHSTVYIDPYVHGNTAYYSVYYKKDYLPAKGDTPFVCGTETEGLEELRLGSPQTEFQGDCVLRRYRLALSCTGEYATFHGGTKPLVLAAMNTTMNRVNGVYENDFAVTMRIIPNNDLLIFLNASTDPFANNDGGTMLGQNQTTVTTTIGSANYDIGHVFSTGGGGVAGLGVVCSTNNKARGVTGGGSPVGDPFDIDYVAHEMGHQFGGNHTQNNPCNNVATASMEPGSASTIMGYAGICSPDVQNNSDDYFHAINLQEIGNYITSGTGNTCPVKTITGNTAPLVNAGADFVIPKNTPFALTATGSDADGDTLSYCWEQMDPQTATMPPVSTNTVGPMFRSFKAVPSPTRFFPRLSDLVSNINFQWEELPNVARTMKFRVTIRDNNDGAGCTEEDDMLVTVSGTAGPFQVTAPNTNIIWLVGDTKTVTWNVNNTNAAPVNCANVRLLLSTDGGFTYPVVLAASVPNNGTADVSVPNNPSNTCRVKVESIGNVFYDISNVNFRIQVPPSPTFTLLPSANSVQICAGATGNVSLNLTSIAGFSTATNVTVSGVPVGAIVNIAPNPVTPTGTAVVNISGITAAMAGNYTLVFTAVGGTVTQSTQTILNLFPGAPSAAPVVVSPLDGAIGVSGTPILTWNLSAYAQNYQVEVATNPSFSAGSIILTETTANDSVAIASALTAGSVYYWRVKATNNCGETAFSNFQAFHVDNPSCGKVYSSVDVPEVIADIASTSTSVLNIVDNKTILDVNVNLTIDHTWIGDLDAVLVSPSGTNIRLFEGPGVPLSQYGCDGDNVNITFDGAATQTAADLEDACGAGAYSIFGAYRPIDNLNVLNTTSSAGEWKLLVTDNVDQDGGSIIAWSLDFCFDIPSPVVTVINNNPLIVPQGLTQVIATNNLSMTTSGTTQQGVFTLLSLPQHGTLIIGGLPLTVGATITQAQINSGVLTYLHNGNSATVDAFLFDVYDQNNTAWIHDVTFNIIIVVNDLTAVATKTQPILCHNDNTGEITVTATGLNGEYEYSINDGPSQTSPVFGNLAPGAYFITVFGQYGFSINNIIVSFSNPPAITASSSVASDDITVNATGGTGALEYSLNGIVFQSSNTFNDVSNGVYTITIRDANGCTTTIEAIVAVNVLLVSLTSTATIDCAGENTGILAVSIGGGQAPIEYSLNGGAYQTVNTFGSLPAGTYTVTARDAGGLMATSNTVVLVDPVEITAATSVAVNVITVTATGGTGTLTYSINGIDFQNSNSFTVLSNGTYAITVKDQKGCSIIAAATVAVPILTISAVGIWVVDCFAATNGNITAQGGGGAPPYRYALNNGGFQINSSFTGLGAGIYVVKVSDAMGTVSELIVTIMQPAQIDITETVVGNDVMLDFSNGVSPYNYTLNGVANAPLQNLLDGVYNVVVTDANGCTNTGSFTIFYPLLNIININVVDPNPCDGLADLIVNVQGGTPPYQISPSLNNLPAGVYTVVVTDALGDSKTQNVTLNPSGSPTVTANVSLNTVVAAGTGGTPPYQYSINGTTFQGSPTFQNVPNGSYTLTIRDSKGCTGTVMIMTSAVIELSTEWGLSVLPNPSTGIFQLQWTNAPAQLRMEIYDAAGRKIQTVDAQPNAADFATDLNLTNLPSGIYLLRMTDGKSSGAMRLVKI